jgi:GTP-binding protein
MTLYSFKNAKFVKTVVNAKDYPVLRVKSGEIMPEIAVIGRSNVGKSSLLNHLFQSRGLVKTSATPGKTQAVNFFVLDEQLVFVDLPGYGYAKVPPAVRKQWGPMVQNYLEKRESLKVILFLFDIRRIPNEEDLQLLEWIAYHQKAMILILTKVDKVTLNERNANTKKILQAFNIENLHYLHYSATKNVGRKELIHVLIDALKDEDKE